MSESKELVPDFDNTLYWCKTCKKYTKFLIYDKTAGPFRCVCQTCKQGYRVSYLNNMEEIHPAITKT